MKLLHILTLTTLLWTAWPADAWAQQREWFLEVAGDLSDVTINTRDATWGIARAAGGRQRDGEFGWLFAAERHRRDETIDWTGQVSGFRRSAPWTVSGTVAFTDRPDFLYRHSLAGEVARDIVAGLVAHGGYRHLQFPDTSVHIVEPALSWYHRGHEFQTRGYVVLNDTTNESSGTVLVRGSVEATPRLRFAAGAAVGSRIFDVTSAANTDADGWTAFGYARVQATSRLSVTVGVGDAHEDPAFRQRSFSAGVRWQF